MDHFLHHKTVYFDAMQFVFSWAGSLMIEFLEDFSDPKPDNLSNFGHNERVIIFMMVSFLVHATHWRLGH